MKKQLLINLKNFYKIAPQDILLAIFALIFTLSLISVFTYLYFANDLKTKEAVMNKNNTGVILLDRNEKVFFKFYQAQYRNFVPLNQIPKQAQQAVLAAEDKQFYHHPGFSLTSIVGALVADLRKGQLDYGGSTITQQLVKNSLLNSSKNFLRKYQELVLAQELERRYSKDAILEMYLNSVYWGEGSFGMESASLTYFNKPAQQLDLAEASMMAGLLTAPSKLSPISGDLDSAKARQKFILQEMVDQKVITPEQKQQAAEEKLVFNPHPDSFTYKAPHFALMVKDVLDQKYGEEQVARSGFVVKTTLDLTWQDFAQKTVWEQVDKLKPNRVSNGAAVVMDPTNGEVRALVGSKDWNDPKFGKFNITTAQRQPGSSFKPIVYAAGLERRIITPATLLHDEPITYKPGIGIAASPYSPKDYDGKFRGQVLVRRALVNSLNIPAVEVENKVGIPTTLEEAKKLGITTLKQPQDYGLSLVLGAGEVKLIDLVGAYSVFANRGAKNEPTLITQIQDKQQQIIYDYKPSPHEVLDPGVSFLISSILSDNATRAEVFGNLLNISRPAAVKTGTTENYRDSLTIGFTPKLVVGVWVGNNDSTTMDQVAGAIGAAPIWKALMEKFSQGTPVEKFSPPDDVAQIPICKSNGLRLKEASSSATQEYFLKGTEPKAFCSGDAKLSPSPNSSGQPSDQPIPVTTPADGQYEQGGWYPVGPGDQPLQFWDGKFYDKPQQEKKKKD